jgi:hypothetical protein
MGGQFPATNYRRRLLTTIIYFQILNLRTVHLSATTVIQIHLIFIFRPILGDLFYSFYNYHFQILNLFFLL